MLRVDSLLSSTEKSFFAGLLDMFRYLDGVRDGALHTNHLEFRIFNSVVI